MSQNRPLSPIERMIDEATGYKPGMTKTPCVELSPGLLLPMPDGRHTVSCGKCSESMTSKHRISRAQARKDLKVIGWTLSGGLWVCEKCSKAKP